MSDLRKAAIIDMGTNTFHLLLVEFQNGSFSTLFKEKVPVKIGKGGINQDRLADDALERAYKTLGDFRNKIDANGISEVFAFATSAVRNAENGKDFVDQVRKTLNIDINVISGQEEAELIYKGIRYSGSLNGHTELMMDIGGGSVEFIIGNNERSLWKESFEVGGQRLVELFHHHDPILPSEIEEMNSYLVTKLAPLLDAIEKYKPTGLVGASGTFDTLTDIYFESLLQCKLTGQHVFQLPYSAYQEIHKSLLTKTREERLQIPGMIPMRVDMIVVASCLIDFILQYVPVPSITCSHYALKEGAISTLIEKKEVAKSA